MSALWSMLGVAALVYAGMVGYVFFGQERLVYLPSEALQATPDYAGLSYEDVFLTAADGARLHGWFVPAARRRGTLLFLHGNAGNVSHRIESIRIFHDLGLDVFIIDYHGYGRSEGRPSESATYDTAAAAWGHLTGERGIDPARIVVFGRSLGGGVAAWLAERERAAGLILESTFTTLADLGAQLYFYLPVRLLSRIHYPTVDRLRAIDAPLLIVHSSADELVPFAHAEALMASANEPKRLLEITGGHNDGFLVSGDHYVESVGEFVRSVLGRAEDSASPLDPGNSGEGPENTD